MLISVRVRIPSGSLKNKNMISIYLDDQRIPTEHPNNGKWEVARNYEEFVSKVTSAGLENIDIISFDHDLDSSATSHFFKHVMSEYKIEYSQIKERTGLHAAIWLIDHASELDLALPQCYSHSANPIGASNIIGVINLYNYTRKKPQSCIRARWAHIKKK